MRGDKARKILEKFKEIGRSGGQAVLIAPMGGRFAEGADYPGRELEAIFLVGIPFDRVTPRVKKYIEYYEKLYGKERGRYYAYIVPALRRASQAMGRALRSRKDRAVIVAGDYRYKKYLKLLPDYFINSFKKTNISQIKEIIEKFNVLR